MALAAVITETAALAGIFGQTVSNLGPDVALHTATTSTTGASETANSGSYARQACTMNTASAGAVTNSTALTFSTLGTIAVTHIGFWSSATYAAGNFAIGAALTASVTAASITIASGAISLTAT
jgi:hypothetical protein